MAMKLPLLAQLKMANLPAPEPEYAFHETRKWRFDFAYPKHNPPIAIEIEGGSEMRGGGRHNRAAGFEKDCIKYSEAAIAGWCVLRFTSRQVANGTALATIARALGISLP